VLVRDVQWKEEARQLFEHKLTLSIPMSEYFMLRGRLEVNDECSPVLAATVIVNSQVPSDLRPVIRQVFRTPATPVFRNNAAG
jgi:hypothetical protein